jgi:predicted metallo-beta-lactamase superfamily hydrolase
MATYVETKDVRILIDPGVALAPKRFGFGPHRLEVERCLEHWDAIKDHAKKSDILIITHYHFDHYNPRQPELFKKKLIFIKDPKSNINRSQKSRSAGFLKAIEGLPREILISDGQSHEFGNTKLSFSSALPHGDSAKLGYVTEVLIEEDFRFIHTSDVQGPCLPEQTGFIIQSNPDVIVSDGGMDFMLVDALANMIRIIRKTDVKKYVIDHHFLRDAHYAEKLLQVFAIAQKRKVEVLTSAGVLGKKNDLLEAERKRLYEEFP